MNAASKWSDDTFLDSLRQITDPDAAECFNALNREVGPENLRRVFQQITVNDGALPTGMPECVRKFFERGNVLPRPGGQELDMNRLCLGQQVFVDHTFPACLVLLLKSVPEGYQAPNLTQILHCTGNLAERTYVRLLGVLQMVVDVCTPRGFEPTGSAIITACKLRLLHEGIRRIISGDGSRPGKLPGYEKQFGKPVNFEDMLGTIMGFSLLVVDGLKCLDVDLREDEENNYYYIWTIFALLIGIHPAGQPSDTSYVPQTLAEAREFYASYGRRHYVSLDQNPNGGDLTEHLLLMFRDLLPESNFRFTGDGLILKAFALEKLPRLYLQDLIGKEAMQRLGRDWIGDYPRKLLNFIPLVVHKILGVLEKNKKFDSLNERISSILLRDLITNEYGGRVTFLVPQRLRDLRELPTKACAAPSTSANGDAAAAGAAPVSS